MDIGISLPDTDGFAARAGEAGEALGDLSAPSRDGAALALGEVDPPVKSGKLAKTVKAEPTALGFVLTAGGPTAPYAGYVHARDPFLTRALSAREADIVDGYGDYVAETIDTI